MREGSHSSFQLFSVGLGSPEPLGFFGSCLARFTTELQLQGGF